MAKFMRNQLTTDNEFSFSPVKIGESVYKEKGSKFIGICLPCNSLEEAKEIISQQKLKYPDATHHCYAWKIEAADGQHHERFNDDGEPNNSAGRPILRQIHASELLNLLVVVLRYYGGVKLGVSGLIKAYGLAASLAILKAGKQIHVKKQKLTVQFDYAAEGLVFSLLKPFQVEILQLVKQEKITLLLLVEKQRINSLISHCSHYPQLLILHHE